MNVSQCAKKAFVCSVAVLLLEGSFLRIAMGELTLTEFLHRAVAVSAAGVISFVWLRFPTGRNFFVKKPIWMIVLLYVVGIGLLVYDGVMPREGMVYRLLPAIPVALAIVPVLFLKKNSGLWGLAAALLAPVPGYVIFLLAEKNAAVLVLAGLHFMLLMKGADKEWFGDDGELCVSIIHMTTALIVLGWGLFFDGFRVLGNALYCRAFPAPGHADHFIRSNLDSMQLISNIPVDFPFLGDPYLIAQASMRYGALLGVVCTVLLIMLVISALLIEDGKGIWQSGLKLSLALPVLLAIAQNWGIHIVYVDIPLLGGDIVGTTTFLILCVGICCAEPADEPDLHEADAHLIRIETCQLPHDLSLLCAHLDDEEQEKIRNLFDGYPICTMVRYQGSLEEICLDLHRQIYGTKDVLVILLGVSVGTSNEQLRQLAEALRDATLWKCSKITTKIKSQHELRDGQMILTLLTV